MASDENPPRVPPEETPQGPIRIGRRRWLYGAASLVGLAGVGQIVRHFNEGFYRESVAVMKADDYSGPLDDILARGLKELGVDRRWVKNKSVMLKPNLVEPRADAPHVNTHPAVVRAAIELFLRWDAAEVFVAEGQGHCRDSHYVLDQSGLGPVLRQAGVTFVDLNHDGIFQRRNPLGFTKLREFHLPKSLRRADLIVSMPKMKTHHWAGVTLSMKNLFGTLPGICYGWPKNVLHHAGIEQSILDITATVRPHLAIIDGIVGMEGDGPIMGTPKPAGVLVLGRNLTAVDATAARLMGFNPAAIPYLAAASGRLGPIAQRHIEQRGETIADCATRFELLDHPVMENFRKS